MQKYFRKKCMIQYTILWTDDDDDDDDDDTNDNDDNADNDNNDDNDDNDDDKLWYFILIWMQSLIMKLEDAASALIS